jgi:O-methyltransferase involved in polyketide biosynthesis
MVMLIAGSNAAATPQGNALLQLLDLRAGEPLAVEVRTKFPLAQRRILIRKPFIREMLNDLATEHPKRALQLVSAGAGLAPLALDWCVQFPSARAFELDIDHMPEKQLAIHRVADNTVAARIQCIPCDLTDTAAAAHALHQAGWRDDAPSLWVLEGLAYYITQEALAALLRLALASHPASRAILEFSGDPSRLSTAALAETHEYHAAIRRLVGAHALTAVDLPALAAAAGASVVQCNHPLEMEQRLGIKPIYHHADDSAMRIALLAPKLGV